MDNSLPQTVGIDISKATLDVFAHPAGCERQFANTVKGHKELIGWLGQWQIDRIAYEATGAYHRQLEQALADLPCVKLNPARARRFAQAVGILAKTDKIDAAILARMATTLQPPVRPATTPQQAKLASVIHRSAGGVGGSGVKHCSEVGNWLSTPFLFRTENATSHTRRQRG